MKLIAVAGTHSGCGKTTLVCRLLESFPGLGAVKISPREGEPRVEWGAGAAGKDTARFVASGAARVARIVGPREAAVALWQRVAPQFSDCPAVVMEGAGSFSLPREGDGVAILVCGDAGVGDRREREAALRARADAIVVVHGERSGLQREVAACSSHIDPERPRFDVSLAPQRSGCDDWAQVVEFVKTHVGLNKA